MKQLLVFIYIIFSVTYLVAQEPNESEIRTIAELFVIENSWKAGQDSHNHEHVEIKEIIPIEIKNRVLFYIVKINPCGFIVISNNRSVEPVIAYSNNSDFNIETDQSNVLFQILGEDLLEREKKSNLSVNVWDQFISKYKKSDKAFFKQWPDPNSTPTGGLIATKWDQDEPYNIMCPEIEDGIKAAGGCVPLSVAQVVNYYKDIGSFHLDNELNYVTYSLGISIDSDSLINNFPSFNTLNPLIDIIRTNFSSNVDLSEQEIAALIFSLGIGLHSDYEYSTGAYSKYIPGFLMSELNYFSAFERGLYDPTTRLNSLGYLIQDIINDAPIIMSGRLSNNIGHSYICDGFNTDGYFHLNLGWGDPFNIWYDIENCFIEPSGIFYNIFPDERAYPLSVYSNSFYGDHINLMLFDPTSIGESSVNEFHLENTSSNSIVLNLKSNEFQISQDGDNYSSEINDLSISPNGSITIKVRFNPTQTIKYKGEVLVESNEQSVLLRCIGHGKPTGGTSLMHSVSGRLTKENSPYYIGSSLMCTGDSLIIDPGVEMIFLGDYSIQNDRAFICNGTDEDSITFKSLSDEFGWRGINISSSPKHCEFTYINFIGNENYTIDRSPFNFVNSEISISNCVFSNFNSSDGGLVNTEGNQTKLNVNNCVFKNNISKSGGAINFETGEIKIKNNIFYGNKSEYGGALFLASDFNSIVEVENNTFFGNEAILSGGAIFAFGNNCFINNNIFSQNICQSSSAIHFERRNENQLLNIYNSNFDSIPGAEINSDHINLINCIKEAPLFISLDEYDFHLSENSPCIDAGSIEGDYSNEPQPNGFRINQGAYGGTSEAATSMGSVLTIRPLDFNQGLVSVNNPDSLELKVYSGGNQMVQIDSVVLQDTSVHSIFSINFSSELEPGDSLLFNISQNIFNHSLFDTITNKITIYSNLGSLEIPISLIPVNGTIIKTDSINGILESIASPFYFPQNVSIYTNDSLVIEQNCELLFFDNVIFKIPKQATLVANGDEDNPIVFNSISDDSKWQGLSFDRSYNNVLNGVRFLNCYKLGSGGAIYLCHSDVIIRNALFDHSDASIEGGGVYAFYSDITIYNSTFDHCIASVNGNGGGAIDVFKANLKVYRSKFFNNSTRVYGGAIEIDNSEFYISNSLFKGNVQVSEYYSGGGALAIMVSSGEIENCTFIENSGKYGGALFLDYKNKVIVENSIFYNNISYNQGHHFSMNNDTHNPDSLLIFNSCIDSVDNKWIHKAINSGYLDTLQNIYDNPLVNEESQIESGSPCINSGQNIFNNSSLDLSENIRIWNETIDIGAYEYGAPLAKTQIIPLQQGWNIFSGNIEPVLPDMLQILSNPDTDVLDNIVKVIDESGNFVQYIPGSDWLNTIGDLSNSEGYYLKSEENMNLRLVGSDVVYPYLLELNEGWNIMGYPVSFNQDPMILYQNLINDGKLLKVISETGGFIENIPEIGWVNTVGNLESGEGYYIKVTEDSELIFEENNGKLSSKFDQINEGQNWKRTEDGNPYLPMHIVAKFNKDIQLLPGDELGVFVDDLCIGSSTITEPSNHIVSFLNTNDPLTEIKEGGDQGDLLSFKLLHKGFEYELNSINISPEELVYNSLETKIIEFAVNGLSVSEFQEKDFFVSHPIPNPASKECRLLIYSDKSWSMQMEIYNISGQLISRRNTPEQSAGNNTLDIDIQNLTTGVYSLKLFIQTSNGEFVEVRKLIVE